MAAVIIVECTVTTIYCFYTAVIQWDRKWLGTRQIQRVNCLDEQVQRRFYRLLITVRAPLLTAVSIIFYVGSSVIIGGIPLKLLKMCCYKTREVITRERLILAWLLAVLVGLLDWTISNIAQGRHTIIFLK